MLHSEHAQAQPDHTLVGQCAKAFEPRELSTHLRITESRKLVFGPEGHLGILSARFFGHGQSSAAQETNISDDMTYALLT